MNDLYALFVYCGIPDKYMQPYEEELMNCSIKSSPSIILTELNKTKMINSKVIEELYSPAYSLEFELNETDESQQNIFHILFSLLLKPHGIFKFLQPDELDNEILQLFNELLSYTTTFSSYFRSVFSQAISVEIDDNDKSALDILAQTNQYKILFICLLFDEKRTSFGSFLTMNYSCPAAYIAYAAEQGNFEAIEIFLAFNYSPNVSIEDESALELAMSSNSPFAIHCCACILESGADVEVTNSQLEQPLYFLSKSTAPFIICELFSIYKADFEARDCKEHTLLYAATRQNNLYAVEALCQHGAIDLPDNNGETALMLAVKNKNLEIIRELIENGRSAVNAVNSNGEAICHMMDCTDVELLKILFGAGLKVFNITNYAVHTEKICDGYMDDYQKAIRKIREYKKTNIVMLDSMEDKCTVCGEAFSITVRRSHCRLCGRIMCGKCTFERELKDSSGVSSKQKVCRFCLHMSLVKRPTQNTGIVNEITDLLLKIEEIEQELIKFIESYANKECFSIVAVQNEIETLLESKWEETGWQEIGEMLI